MPVLSSPPDFPSYLNAASSLRLTSTSNDVLLLAAGGRPVAAHRAVLASHSEVLRDVFNEVACRCGSGHCDGRMDPVNIVLGDFSAESVAALVEVLYLCIGVTKDPNELLELARVLKIDLAGVIAEGPYVESGTVGSASPQLSTAGPEASPRSKYRTEAPPQSPKGSSAPLWVRAESLLGTTSRLEAPRQSTPTTVAPQVSPSSNALASTAAPQQSTPTGSALQVNPSLRSTSGEEAPHQSTPSTVAPPVSSSFESTFSTEAPQQSTHTASAPQVNPSPRSTLGDDTSQQSTTVVGAPPIDPSPWFTVSTQAPRQSTPVVVAPPGSGSDPEVSPDSTFDLLNASPRSTADNGEAPHRSIQSVSLFDNEEEEEEENVVNIDVVKNPVSASASPNASTSSPSSSATPPTTSSLTITAVRSNGQQLATRAPSPKRSTITITPIPPYGSQKETASQEDTRAGSQSAEAGSSRTRASSFATHDVRKNETNKQRSRSVAVHGQSRNDQAGPSSTSDKSSEINKDNPKPSTSSQVGSALANPKHSQSSTTTRKLSIDLANPRLSLAACLARKRAAQAVNSRPSTRTRWQTTEKVNRNDLGPPPEKYPRMWSPEDNEYADKALCLHCCRIFSTAASYRLHVIVQHNSDQVRGAFNVSPASASAGSDVTCLLCRKQLTGDHVAEHVCRQHPEIADKFLSKYERVEIAKVVGRSEEEVDTPGNQGPGRQGDPGMADRAGKQGPGRHAVPGMADRAGSLAPGKQTEPGNAARIGKQGLEKQTEPGIASGSLKRGPGKKAEPGKVARTGIQGPGSQTEPGMVARSSKQASGSKKLTVAASSSEASNKPPSDRRTSPRKPADRRQSESAVPSKKQEARKPQQQTARKSFLSGSTGSQLMTDQSSKINIDETEREGGTRKRTSSIVGPASKIGRPREAENLPDELLSQPCTSRQARAMSWSGHHATSTRSGSEKVTPTGNYGEGEERGECCNLWLTRRELHRHMIEKHFLVFLTRSEYFDNDGVCQLCGAVVQETLDRANHTAYVHDKLFDFVPQHLEKFFK